MNSNMSRESIIKRIQSVPEHQRALILFGVLVDCEYAKSVLEADHRTGRSAESVLEDLLHLNQDVRIPLVLTMLGDVLHSLGSNMRTHVT
jgi:hypothetical protein